MRTLDLMHQTARKAYGMDSGQNSRPPHSEVNTFHRPNVSLESVMPTEASERKGVPMASGLLDYFPAALAEVARVSKAGNDQHNPGQPLHWSRGKSGDHADTIVRHLVDRGTIDTDGLRHSAKAAWRALALLQEELEAAGSPPGRGSKFPEPKFICPPVRLEADEWMKPGQIVAVPNTVDHVKRTKPHHLKSRGC